MVDELAQAIEEVSKTAEKLAIAESRSDETDYLLGLAEQAFEKATANLQEIRSRFRE
jgi:hypothetical protein